MATLPPVPIRNPVLDPATGWFQREIVRFLDTLRVWLSRTAQERGTVALEGQAAAVAPTDVPMPETQAGLYRASYSLRVTQAATTSSSTALTVAWTSGGVSCSSNSAAVTGNTTASETNGVIVMDVDGGTAVVYSLTYASVGATSMQYALDLRLEELP